MRPEAKALDEKVAQQDSATALSRARIRKADAEIEAAQENMPRAVQNVINAAAEAYILKVFKLRFVIIPVRRFLKANNTSKELGGPELIKWYKAGRRLAPAAPFKDFKEFVEVQKRALQVVADFRVFATDAAEILAGHSFAEAMELSNSVSNYVDTQALDIQAAAARENSLLYRIGRIVVMSRK